MILFSLVVNDWDFPDMAARHTGSGVPGKKGNIPCFNDAKGALGRELLRRHCVSGGFHGRAKLYQCATSTGYICLINLS